MKLNNFFNIAYSKEYMKTKKVDELWGKYNKPYFQYFIFGSLASYIFAALVFLAIFITYIILRSNYISELTTYLNAYINNSSSSMVAIAPEQQAAVYFNSEVSINGIIFIVSLALVFHFIYSLVKNIEQKNYQKLSILASFIFLIYILYNFVNLIINLFGGLVGTKKLFDFNILPIWSSFNLIRLITPIVLLILYLVFVRYLRKIKIAFINAYHHEEMLKAQEMFKNQDLNFNDFFSQFMNRAEYQTSENSKQNEVTENNINKNNSSDIEKEKAKTKREIYFDKINQLPNNKLFEMAEKLYISGYSKMTREELIEAILNATNN
ncbi:Rho termination factor N-terminal domain-containing protein [Mycoplasmopsis meleagridis]|uniref:Rho termination factor N-terminal domain-containing protein n=1 Tax=Mycoplasmopsis meleagridis TaxID=29561 RepID=UPI00073D729D|nr:Rho termination factor N-terminal domain-containing protein [Mycoplasmopsis meleagridis]KUH47538.1 hypothetical protein ASB56_00165 [Mycoplasmopsis meleagridis]